MKFVLVGEMALASEKDLDYLNQWIQDDYYTVKVTDKTKIELTMEIIKTMRHFAASLFVWYRRMRNF